MGGGSSSAGVDRSQPPDAIGTDRPGAASPAPRHPGGGAERPAGHDSPDPYQTWLLPLRTDRSHRRVVSLPEPGRALNAG